MKFRQVAYSVVQLCRFEINVCTRLFLIIVLLLLLFYSVYRLNSTIVQFTSNLQEIYDILQSLFPVVF